MITVRAGSTAIAICLLLVTSGCSREQQDWRSAEAADSIDSYSQFIQRHPDSELVTQARARVAQLGEDRDWQRAGSADTVDAYREFISQHPSGKWAQEAHIRIENFSLGEQAGTDAGTKVAAAAGAAMSGSTTTRSAAVGGPRAQGSSAPSGGAAAPGGAAALGGPVTAGVGTSGAPTSGTAGAPTSGTAGAAITATAPLSAGAPGGRSSRLAPATPAAEVGPGAVAGWKAQVASKAGSPMAAAADAAPAGASAPRSSSPALAPSASVSSKVGPAAAGSARAGTGKGGFGIQLGAFSNEASASAQWRLLTARYASELQGLQEHLVPANAPSGRIYRLQAIVGDEGRARTICDQLKKNGQACVAVLPH